MSESAVNEVRQYVLFSLCGEEYGLPIAAVRSVIRFEDPTPVPHAPAGVEGVFNLRGQILPLVDLGRQLRGAAIEPTALSRIIVAEAGVGSVGLAVDRVHEVASIPVEQVRPAPAAALTTEMGEAFEGVATYGDRLVILLDPDKALPKPVLASSGAIQEDELDA